MAEKFERTKPHVNVGTIGHVDHGKTTLTAAILHSLNLTGHKVRLESIDQIDAAPEEKRAVLRLRCIIRSMNPTSGIMHIDAPGHADYIKI